MIRDKSFSAIEKRPTLRTISELTGFAVTTVSRALSGAPEIAEETRKRVNEVAQEIGYVPDRAAQRLRTGRTNVISLILSPHNELLGFQNAMITGLTNALRNSPFNLVVTPSFEEKFELSIIQDIVRNRGADGIVFSRTKAFDERVRFLMENDFPFVCHGRTEFSKSHLFFDYDSTEFARLAVERLLKKGRKRIVALVLDQKYTCYSHFKYGLSSRAVEGGFTYEIPEELHLDRSSKEIYAAVARKLKGDQKPDGFICGGEMAGMTVMACLEDHGLRVGKDVDVIVKQISSLFDHVRPKVDTILEDITGAGIKMGELLLNKISHKESSEESYIQKPVLRFLE